MVDYQLNIVIENYVYITPYDVNGDITNVDNVEIIIEGITIQNKSDSIIGGGIYTSNITIQEQEQDVEEFDLIVKVNQGGKILGEVIHIKIKKYSRIREITDELPKKAGMSKGLFWGITISLIFVLIFSFIIISDRRNKNGKR